MLLDKLIRVKVSNRTKKYFLSKGYLEIFGYFFVRPEDMNHTNRTKVDCACDYCKDVRKITWSNYVIQINKTSEGIYTCHKCHFNKTKIVYMKNFGVDNIQSLSEIRDKIKFTCLKKYGVDCVLKSTGVKDKIKESLLEKYGVDHPMKNEEIFIKAQKSSFKHIKYKNTNLHYQGGNELDFINYCISKDISLENGPTIRYSFQKKQRIYYSDFFVRELNLIIEIKSTYTMNCDYDENLAKKEYSIKSGYNFLFIIDKDYKEFDKLFRFIL